MNGSLRRAGLGLRPTEIETLLSVDRDPWATGSS